MLDCRYYGNCYFMECDVPDRCDGKGRCVSYRNGHDVDTRCQFYEPMPDIEALMRLAEGLEESSAIFDRYRNAAPGIEYLAGNFAETYRHVAGIIRRSIGDGNGHE